MRLEASSLLFTQEVRAGDPKLDDWEGQLKISHPGCVAGRYPGRTHQLRLFSLSSPILFKEFFLYIQTVVVWDF